MTPRLSHSSSRHRALGPPRARASSQTNPVTSQPQPLFASSAAIMRSPLVYSTNPAGKHNSGQSYPGTSWSCLFSAHRVSAGRQSVTRRSIGGYATCSRSRCRARMRHFGALVSPSHDLCSHFAPPDRRPDARQTIDCGDTRDVPGKHPQDRRAAIPSPRSDVTEGPEAPPTPPEEHRLVFRYP
jgi:hypothetical protein